MPLTLRKSLSARDIYDDDTADPYGFATPKYSNEAFEQQILKSESSGGTFLEVTRCRL